MKRLTTTSMAANVTGVFGTVTSVVRSSSGLPRRTQNSGARARLAEGTCSGALQCAIAAEAHIARGPANESGTHPARLKTAATKPRVLFSIRTQSGRPIE